MRLPAVMEQRDGKSIPLNKNITRKEIRIKMMTVNYEKDDLLGINDILNDSFAKDIIASSGRFDCNWVRSPPTLPILLTEPN